MSNSTTIEAYNRHARTYDFETADFWGKFPQGILERFAADVGTLGIVADIGSGPGRDGKLLKQSGLRVVCFDRSATMAALSLEKGLPSIQADFLGIPTMANCLAGVWAYTSLLHIPKYQLPTALGQIYESLIPGGVLGLGMIEGYGEGLKPWVNGDLRYFAYYQQDEITNYLRSAGFIPYFLDKFVPRTRTYLNFLTHRK